MPSPALSLFALLAMSTCTLSLAADNQLSEVEKKTGWQLLFNGKDHTGWKCNNGKPIATPVENGALLPYKSGGYIVIHEKQFGDFIFKCDVRWEAEECNSGIFFRVEKPIDPVNTGFEAQVHSGDETGKHTFGAIYDLVDSTESAGKATGEWNTVEITCRGPMIEVKVNDRKVCSMNCDEFDRPGYCPDGYKHKYKLNGKPRAVRDFARRGYLGFQDHGQKVWYKNVKVLQLNKTPKNAATLFNGDNLGNWHGMDHFDPYQLQAMGDEERSQKQEDDFKDFVEHWTIENGELVNDGHGVYATTDREFGDIELWIDYKTVPLADSGIYLRGTPQVQIWDPNKEEHWKLGADKGSGGLWNNSAEAPGKDPLVLADRPFGEWNSFHVVQVGARTSVTFNDQLVVDHATMENYWDRAKPLPRTGPIQLQTHGGEIRWRNIFVREIGAEEANTLLAGKNAEGFESIFNGKDLDGWQGAVENYEAKNGSLVCKPGHGGTLFTKEEYGDFVVRLEFKLPPGGNNGLAIRYPGKGGPSVDAMCELQVLDDTHTMYAELDTRQYHGSIYGMVAAERGYLRPVGEWNFQEVTVKGSTIKVELNGSVIVDADVSQVTETLDDKEHSGKDLKSGYFGFAGHNDPVEFRNIQIKRLD